MKYIIPILFLFSMISAQTVKQRIAVLELEADGVSQSESVTLTNRLRSELVKTGSFIIVERGEMDEILKEQGFQMSGCTSNECAVQAGRLLNVNQIAAGSIGKVGNLYTVGVRLIDVESGEIIKTVTEDCQCPIERVLTNSMRNAALKLSGRMSASGAALLTEGSGDLFIKTNLPGADIYLDNIQTGKAAPATIEGVAAGQHFIKAIKGEYIGTKSVIVKAGDLVSETITLEKAKGGVKVYSTPPDAEILIDGEKYGRTPKIIRELSTGDHLLELRLDGFAIHRGNIKINHNQLAKINAVLKRLGILKIQSDPTAASVYIDGEYRGVTPHRIKLGPDREISVKINKDNYTTWEKTIILKEGGSETIEARLKKQKGTVTLSRLPAGAELVVNGQRISGSFDKLALTVGSYDVEISKPGFKSKSFNLLMRAGQEENLNAGLEKKTTGGAVTRSLFIPGWGQAYQDKTARAWIYGLTFAGGVAGSFIYTDKYNSSIADYNIIHEQYMEATEEEDILRLGKEMESAYDDINSAESMRNVFYGITAGVYLWNILDTIILPPSWQTDARVSAVPIKDGIMLGMVYKW